MTATLEVQEKQQAREADPPQPSVVKLSFNVSPQQLDAIKQLAQKRGVSMTEVLRHAIAVETFLQEELAQPGTRIIVENQKDDSRKELVLLGPWR